MNKKICIVEPFGGEVAGAQKVTLNILDILKKNASVEVILRSSRGNIFEQYNKKNINYSNFPFEKMFKASFGKANSFKKMLFFDFFKFSLFIFIINIYMVFKSLISKYNTIYTYDTRGLLVCFLVGAIFNKKLIWHSHGSLVANRHIYRFLFLFVDQILVPSRDTYNEIRNVLGSENKLKLIYNGFDFAEPNKYKNQTFNNKLVFIGSIVPHKGLHNIINAMSILGNDSLELHVIGGPNSADLRYYNHVIELSNNISNKIEYHGWLIDPLPVLKSASILLFPSILNQNYDYGAGPIPISSSEALPTVLIESLVNNIPVLAVKTPGVNDIVSSKRDGLVIEESDPQTIAEALDFMISNYHKFSPNFLEKRSKFSFENMEKKINETFNNL